MTGRTKHYILFEHAVGYALFLTKEVEKIAMLLPEVQNSITDLSRFRGVISLVGVLPFKTAVTALHNMNCISEGLVSKDLQLFLDSCIPKSTKKESIILGLTDHTQDKQFTKNINITLGIQCLPDDSTVLEIIRGIRYHFHNLVTDVTEQNAKIAQLGLGHSYSRGKVKFNVNRVDNMIIQCITLLEQLDKDINTFSMRIREWYSYHFPELVKIVPENYLYARVAGLIKNRKELEDEEALKQQLEEILMDGQKVKAIIGAAKISMGMDICPNDLANIESFSRRIVGLVKYKEKMSEYLAKKMETIAPSLATLIGEHVGAKLIAHAGSLTSLAKAPASTIQILGAEKALFRALKTRQGNTPKYGLLFHSSFIGRADPKNKGRIARFLANKCSIASRIDCFSERPLNIFGNKLREQVEERLKFLETGVEPAKNLDVMKIALQETKQALAALEKQEKEKQKKKRKRQSNESEKSQMNGSIENGEAEANTSLQKKKKKRQSNEIENNQMDGSIENDEAEANTSLQKKKKKKSKHTDDN